MQTPTDLAAPPVEVRPPWPDEMTRLRHFLPGAFLFDARPEAFVVVRGGVERIVAAAALNVRTTEDGERAGRLYVRADAEGAAYGSLVVPLARHALARAWAAGVSHVFLAHTVPENSGTTELWQNLGFRVESTLETYEISSRRSWERLERLHHLLRARGLVPPGVELLAMLPRLVEPVRRFLARHMPGGVVMLAAENTGYKPEHSHVLLVNGEVKGVLLARREGGRIGIGLRLVAPELRGGVSWANLLLIHRSLHSGLQSGQETSRFDLDPAVHADTRQLALAHQARLVGFRLFLRVSREKAVDDGTTVS